VYIPVVQPPVPLSAYPVLSTTSIAEAEQGIGRNLANGRIVRIDRASPFRFDMNATSLGHAALVYNRYATEAVIEGSLNPECFYFNFGGEAPTTFRSASGVSVASPEQCVILRPGQHVRIERPAGSTLLVIRAPRAALRRHLEQLTDRHHQGDLTFEGEASIREGPGGLLHRTVRHVVNEIGGRGPEARNPGMLRLYEQLLLGVVLWLPHSKRHALRPARYHDIAPAVVRRAEEYMQANLARPISIVDVLRACRCSRSTLFQAFRASRGHTPMEFLTEQRLLRAQEALRDAETGATVASIARACGFVHLGRFSQVYARRFGERPSDTLRRVVP